MKLVDLKFKFKIPGMKYLEPFHLGLLRGFGCAHPPSVTNDQRSPNTKHLNLERAALNNLERATFEQL